MGDETGSALRTLVKGAGIMVVATFASKVMMYLYRIVVAREDIGIGPEAYGMLSIGLAVFWVGVTLASAGTGNGIQRRISDYIGKGEEDRIPAVVWAAMSITLPLSFAVSAALFLAADLLAVHVFHDPGVAVVIRGFALAIPLQVLYKNGAAVIWAFRDVRYIAVTDKLVRSALTLLVTVALIASGMGVLSAVIGQVVAIATAAVLILYFAETRVQPFLKRRVVDPAARADLFHYSWPLFLSGLIGLVVGWTDTLLLGFFDTSKNVGIYNAALPTAQLINVIPAHVGGMLFPTVSEFYGRGEKQRAEETATVSMKWLFLVTFPAVVLLALFGGPILRLLFGPVYVAGSAALAFLATAYFLQAMTNYAGSFIKSEEWTKLAMGNSLLVAVSNLALNLVLIPMYGPMGAGIASALSLLIGGVAGVVEVYYLFGVFPFRVRLFLPGFLATLLAAGVTYMAVHAFFDVTPVWALVPAFLLFAALYGALFLLFGGLDEHDVMILNAVDEKTPADLTPVKRLVQKLAR